MRAQNPSSTTASALARTQCRLRCGRRGARHSRAHVPGVQRALQAPDHDVLVIQRDGAAGEHLLWVAQQRALLDLLLVPHHHLQRGRASRGGVGAGTDSSCVKTRLHTHTAHAGASVHTHTRAGSRPHEHNTTRAHNTHTHTHTQACTHAITSARVPTLESSCVVTKNVLLLLPVHVVSCPRSVLSSSPVSVLHRNSSTSLPPTAATLPSLEMLTMAGGA